MFPKMYGFVIALLALWSSSILAQEPANDPLQSLLLPPELLIQHREQIGLSDAQVERIRAQVEKVGPAAQGHQTRLKDALGRLAQSLSAERVDEDAASKELDQVLAAEKELKNLHMRLLIQIRNDLTAEQRRTASGINQAATSGKELEQRLKAKISLIQKEVESRAQAGQPSLEVVALMQKLPELMQNGQVREAEAVLDRAIAMLGLKQPSGTPNQPPGTNPPPGLVAKAQQVQKLAEQKQQNGEDVSEIAELMQKAGSLVGQGKHKEAEALIDQALKILGVQPGKPATDSQPGKSDKPNKDPAAAKPDDAKSIRQAESTENR